jgi:hypothetical protein
MASPVGGEEEQVMRRQDHMVRKGRFSVAREAIEVVLLHLECLDPSDGTERLHASVNECLRETDHWRASPPTDRERDGLMTRVLALYVEVMKLEREAPLAEAKAFGCT